LKSPAENPGFFRIPGGAFVFFEDGMQDTEGWRGAKLPKIAGVFHRDFWEVSLLAKNGRL